MQQHRGQLVLWLGAVLVLIKGYESTLVQGKLCASSVLSYVLRALSLEGEGAFCL